MIADLIAAIDNAQEREREETRSYLGASVIGNECDAFLAFALRGFPEDKVPARVRRIFRLGHLLEREIVKDLKKAGASVWEVDEMTGKQHAYESYGGHVKGHADGHIQLKDGVLRLLEIKSMNDASFGKFVDDGVARSHPRYMAQMQMLMGMSGIHSCLFIAQNKNTSAYHAEIVSFDVFTYSHLCHRAELAMRGEAARIAPTKTDWRCRFCSRSGVCWGEVEAPKKCSTCASATPANGGAWWCSKHGHAAERVCGDWTAYQPLEKP